MKITGKNIGRLGAGGFFEILTAEKALQRLDRKAAFTDEIDSENGDAIPIESKPEDFIFVQYRQISATIVGSGTEKSTDFSNQEVLKEAIPMFRGKTVFLNHDWEIGEHIGVIGEAEWQGVTEAAGGVIVPAGINAPYIVDKVLRPSLAREMKSLYTPLKSVSITVSYEWVSSHDFASIDEFERYVGRILDGREVTRVVTKIENVWESSLVWEGADHYAKMIGADGVIMLEKSVKNNDTLIPVNNENKKDSPIMEKEIISMTKAEFEAKETANKSILEAVKSDLAAQKTLVSELNALVEGQKSFVEYGKAAKNERITEAKRLYSASLKGKEINPAMIADIEASSFEVLTAKIELFGGKVESSLTRTCNKCGCTDVSLRSSKPSEMIGETTTEAPKNSAPDLGF